MAMITCPECGKEVSERATSCPSCGYPFQERAAISKEHLLRFAAVISGAVLFVVLFTQTTLFWSSKDKALMHCSKMIQNNLLAPDSLLIYSAMIWDESTDESEDSSSGADATAPTQWIWVHYGAGTKGGGISESVALFEKSEGKWTMHKRNEKEYNTSSLEGSKSAAGAAIYNIWLDRKMFDVQLYGEMYSEKVITRITEKLT